MHICELETPCVLVDYDRLNANIKRMADYCKAHTLDLRAHVKSHKSPMIAYKQLEEGACGIACQKLSEAEVFLDAGFDDIFVPYNIVGEPKLARLMRLAKEAVIRVAVDSHTVAQGISQAAQRAGLSIPVLIEMDTGGKRCGTQSPQDTLALAQAIDKLPNVNLAGIMTFPSPPRCRPFIQETLNLFEKAGLSAPIVSGGGTPEAFQTHNVPEINELRVGTYVFYDFSHVLWRACQLSDCALTVLTTVVSTPTPERAILDAGAKTLTRNHRTNPNPVYGVLKDNADATLYALSEEHGHLNAGHVKIGEKVEVVPVDSWAVISLNDTYALVKDEEVLEILPISARGRTL